MGWQKTATSRRWNMFTRHIARSACCYNVHLSAPLRSTSSDERLAVSEDLISYKEDQYILSNCIPVTCLASHEYLYK